jgi:hypothetical protein
LPKSPLSLALKGSAGFVIALAAWWALSAPYTRLLAVLSEPVIRLVERPRVTRLLGRGTELTIDRSDFPPSSPRPSLGTTGITDNFILLATLFAASARALSDRNVFGFATASLALVFVHVAAVVANVQSIYASRLGIWSTIHYGAFARTFWGMAVHFYSVVGVFASAFALWWLFSERDGRRIATW